MPLLIGYQACLSLGSREEGRAAYQGKVRLPSARAGTGVSLNSKITTLPPTLQPAPHHLESLRLSFLRTLCDSAYVYLSVGFSLLTKVMHAHCKKCHTPPLILSPRITTIKSLVNLFPRFDCTQLTYIRYLM